MPGVMAGCIGRFQAPCFMLGFRMVSCPASRGMNSKPGFNAPVIACARHTYIRHIFRFGTYIYLYVYICEEYCIHMFIYIIIYIYMVHGLGGVWRVLEAGRRAAAGGHGGLQVAGD